jgi:hypothetical protein
VSAATNTWLVLGLCAFLVALMFLLIGALAYRARREDNRLARRIRHATPIPIAGAADGTIVQICGQVSATEQGVVQSPITSRWAVLWRLDVKRREATSDGSRYAPYHAEKTHLEFYLDDGSGQRARVVPVPGQSSLYANADVFGPRSQSFSSDRWLSTEVPPELRRWLGSRTNREPPENLVFEERLVVPGQTVSVLGRASWRAAPQGTGRELLIDPRSGPCAEVVIWTMSKADLLAQIRVGQILIWAFVATGALALFAALTLVAIGLVSALL